MHNVFLPVIMLLLAILETVLPLGRSVFVVATVLVIVATVSLFLKVSLVLLLAKVVLTSLLWKVTLALLYDSTDKILELSLVLMVLLSLVALLL